MASIITPNMNLVVPVVGSEAGPTYASDINNSLTILDGHNHSSGSGVQITPSGLNINTNLPMNQNSLVSIGALTFQAVTADAGLVSLYVKGVDLYYEDGSGNVIRITQSGSVAGASGTITGLPSGTASASYSAGTFTFQAATNTAANIDGGSFIFRDSTAGSFGVTVKPQNALSSNYTLTLPLIPAQTNVVTLDSSGNFGSVTYDQVGQSMTSIGANAIVASANAVTSAFSDLVGEAMTVTGTTALLTTAGTTGADIVGQNMSPTGANSVAATIERGVASGTGGLSNIVFSGSSGVFTASSSGFVQVTGLNMNVYCNRNAIEVRFQPDQSGTGALVTSSGSNRLSIQNNTSGTIYYFQLNGQNAAVGGFSVLDLTATPGMLNNYIVSVEANGSSTTIVQNVRLIGHEIH